MTRIVELEMAKISSLFNKMMDLLTNNAHHRIVSVLNELRDRFGNTLPFTHQEIAEISGTTTETATRSWCSLKTAAP
jgi:CRP-like cAMP-binding protein